MKINSSYELKDYIIKLRNDENISQYHDFIYDNELIELTHTQRFANLLPEYFDWLEYDTLYMITPLSKKKRSAKGLLKGRKIFYYYRPSGRDVIYYVVKSDVSGNWLDNVWYKESWIENGYWIRAYAKLNSFKESRILMNWDKEPWSDLK